jgi:LPXTG-motif cell wall-anchored protein
MLELTNLDTNEVQTMKTNEDGLYLFAALEPGRYNVVSFKPSSDTSRTTPSSFTITLAEAEAFLDADFGYSDVLPETGMEIEALARIGAALLALGLVFVGYGRRRREEG